MRSITVLNHLSLDGVMQAPGRPEEDTRGGFDHGGWAAPDNDPVMGELMGSLMSQARGSLLLGRRTYEDFAAYWPAQTDNPFTPVLEATEKLVVSRTLREPLPWKNSRLLSGDGAALVAELKEQPGGDLMIMGSGELVKSLLPHGLIDRLMLMIHPIVLGRGERMFADEGALRASAPRRLGHHDDRGDRRHLRATLIGAASRARAHAPLARWLSGVGWSARSRGRAGT